MGARHPKKMNTSLLIQKKVSYAQGYIELGMIHSALVVVDEFTLDEQKNPLVLSIKADVYIHLKRYAEAFDYTETLCKVYPELPESFIQHAYVLHELKRTQEAREILKKGPKGLKAKPVFYYNMACYECTLGNIDEARRLLREAIKRDRTFEKLASEDSDLELLHLKE